MSGAFAIDIDIQGAAELAELWRQAPELTRHELTAATLEAELLLEHDLKELEDFTPRGATGTLRSKISHQEPKVLADTVLGVVGTSVAHAVAVELGTKPHWVPIEPLKDWVRAKLAVEDERQVAGIAHAIQWKIKREGTEGAHMFQRAFEKNRGQIARMFEDARRRIRDRLSGSGNA